MQGLMMNVPLMIASLIRHADRWHGDTEIVSRTIEGPIHRYTYRDAHVRARRLARALLRLGVREGDRVATLAWNTHRHFELYYGISGMGAVIHTVNPRLFFDQIVYIVRHAEDRFVFFDLSFAPLVAKLAPECPGVEAWIAMTDRDHLPASWNPGILGFTLSNITHTDGLYHTAFLRTFEGPVNDNIAQIGASIADTQIGSELGITNVAHLRDLTVTGPYNPTGVSETASRHKIFTCRPTTPDEERPCAEKIISSIGGSAYRRPLQPRDVKGLMTFFDQGRAEGGFELGVRMALEAILSSPHFIFRVEELPAGARPGQRYAVSPMDLASRRMPTNTLPRRSSLNETSSGTSTPERWRPQRSTEDQSSLRSPVST